MKLSPRPSHRPAAPLTRHASRVTRHASRLTPQHGIALVIVMISVMVLTILAAGFAYSMKVETKLARNANSEAELEWLGRSGVEYARWVLANSLMDPTQPYDSLDQPWATGSGELGPTNAPIAEVQNPFTLGRGTVTWKITDLERKFNINAPEPVLQQILPQAFNLIGVSPGDSTPAVNSILDWIDPDDQTHVEGAESRDYEALDPPYDAKNGPIDDISELLLIKGITPEMYYGAAATNYQPTYFSQDRNRFSRNSAAPPLVTAGLRDLFTPLSDGKININTASAEVLQLIPGVDDLAAQAIVSGRAGEPDPNAPGMLGPYRNVGEIQMKAPNIPLALVSQITPYCDVRSRTFQVQVDADVGGYKRTFYAILGRNNPRDVQILSFYWK